MATSSFTTSVTINRKSAKLISKILKKKMKFNTKGMKKAEQLKKEDLKKYKF